MVCSEHYLTKRYECGRTLISVKATVKSSADSVKCVVNGQLSITTRSVPENNQANKCIIKLLSDFLSVPRTCICIYRGHKSRNKVFLVDMEITDEFIFQRLMERKR